MSNEEELKKPESEMGLDLDLHFLPAWAQKPAESNRYESFTGQEGSDEGRPRGRRDRDRGPRDDRSRRPSGPGGGGGAPGGRPRFEGRREGGRPGERGRDFRPGGRGPGGPGGYGGGAGGAGRPAMDRPQIKLPELEVTFTPEDKGVESLARQIKLSGRAYPLFEIGYLVLKKPERYHVQLAVRKKEDGTVIQPMHLCGLDDTLWLDESEAMHHVLDKHFGTFYSTEKIPTDPPKGVYTFVAQCGMSGVILGPPNYHDYQNKLRKLHQERFARMPFEMFKARIKIVKDEAVVKKWLEEQSFRTEFTCLNIPETLKLNTREEVEKHFRETHLANVIKPVETFQLDGADVADLQARPLQALIRRSYEDQMRFPIKVVNILSGQFARQGLQFFKVNKSVTHVAVARPKYLDYEATPVSEGIRKIVDYLNAHPRTTRKRLLEGLAPGSTSAPASVPPAEPPPAPAEGGAGEAPAPVAAPAAPAVSSEATQISSNLHWLIHQGHVIEFANGILETAKRPAPRPPRPERAERPDRQAKAEPADAEVTTQEGISEGQGVAAETEQGSAQSSEAPAEGVETEITPAEPEAALPAEAPVPAEGAPKSGPEC